MVLATIAGGQTASAQLVSNPRQLMGFGFDDLERFAEDAGWTSYRVNEEESEVLVLTVRERRLVLWPRACDSRDICRGLYIFALIPSQASSAKTNAFNVEYNPARATIRDGQVVLDRYLIGDFGVSRGTLSIELQVQAELIDDWWAFTQTNKASATAVAYDPLLENYATETPSLDMHFDSLDLSPSLLDKIAAGNGPRP